MKIWVSSLAKVHDTAASVKPDSVVSLLSPGDVFPQIEGLDADDHHKVHLHDIREHQEDRVTPNELHVEGVVRFLQGWRPDAPLLVHCWAGISRSTATAYIAACMHNPEADERRIAETLREASPTAFPNTLIVAIADGLLGRSGRMSAAIDAMCADEARAAHVMRAGEGTPFSIPARF